MLRKMKIIGQFVFRCGDYFTSQLSYLLLHLYFTKLPKHVLATRSIFTHYSYVQSRLIYEAEVLEATIMSSLPADVVDLVYDYMESRKCPCPSGCPATFHIEDLEEVFSPNASLSGYINSQLFVSLMTKLPVDLSPNFLYRWSIVSILP